MRPHQARAEVTVSWASPPKHSIQLSLGLLPQTDVGNQKLQVRAAATVNLSCKRSLLGCSPAFLLGSTCMELQDRVR